jgi:hypothetical protein
MHRKFENEVFESVRFCRTLAYLAKKCEFSKNVKMLWYAKAFLTIKKKKYA